MSKSSVKKSASQKKYNYMKKKGLAMTSDMMKNPENYKNRVCVAYDAKNNAKPYMYVLIGNHDHNNEHDIRKIYAQTVGINYYDTRIILYSTYVKRSQNARVEMAPTML